MAPFKISKERKQFLLENFVEYSFEQDENGNDLTADKSLFDSISSSHEIFFLSQCCNWDDGAVIPLWIIESPYCTKAAALTVFWQSAPYEYMEYEFGSKIKAWRSEEIDEEQTSILNLLELLVRKFEADDFDATPIAFDFNVWGGKLLVDQPKWTVNEEFFQSIRGIEVV